MKKKVSLLLLAAACMMLLTGCFCQHQWQEATCKTPRTCSKCGKTEGETTTHSFLPATCTAPRTCRYCGLTEGTVAEHTWVDATCTAPRTCSVCGAVEGDVLEHSWADATTEAPKTCTVCGKTEGEPIKTDPRFTTSAAAQLLGTWGVQVVGNSESLGLEGFPGEIAFSMTLEFGPDGKFTYGVQVQDEESFKESMVQYTLAQTYAQLAEEGLNQEAADASFWDTYGMTTEQYVRQTVEAMNFNELFSAVSSALNMGGVYYVEAPFLYNALTWEDEMDITMFGFDSEGGLYIYDYFAELGLDARFVKIHPDAEGEEPGEAAEEAAAETEPAAATEETTEAAENTGPAPEGATAA